MRFKAKLLQPPDRAISPAEANRKPKAASPSAPAEDSFPAALTLIFDEFSRIERTMAEQKTLLLQILQR